MYEVRVGRDESIDDALRRFKRLCEGNIKEMQKRRHYEKPSDIRKKRRSLSKNRNKQ